MEDRISGEGASWIMAAFTHPASMEADFPMVHMAFIMRLKHKRLLFVKQYIILKNSWAIRRISAFI